jgi:cyanophycinase
MYRFFIILFTLFFLTPAGTFADGWLYIIGGGKRPPAMITEIVDLAGGPNAAIMIIPNASGDPEGTARYQKEQFSDAGAGSVDYLIFDRTSVDADSNLQRLKGITGVFFSGGDQRRLTRDLLGTKMLAEIFGIYRSGGVIAGTSAGAAVMSRIMITGDELLNTDSTNAFSMIRRDNIAVSQGFGFITSAVIDQHFIRRKRVNRLISVVLENPDLLGIGIDESTAIQVNPDKTLQVSGENTVMVIDAAQATNILTDPNGNFSAGNLTVHLLRSGQVFDPETRQVIP